MPRDDIFLSRRQHLSVSEDDIFEYNTLSQYTQLHSITIRNATETQSERQGRATNANPNPNEQMFSLL